MLKFLNNSRNKEANMNNLLQLGRNNLLDPSGITDAELESVMGKILVNGVDYADLYFQSTYSESWFLEDGIIKGGNYDVDRGIGVRALSGEKTGFAYADDIMLPALEQAATTASSIVKHGQEKRIKAWQKRDGHELYLPVNPLTSWNETEKINLLQRLDQYIHQLDKRIVQAGIGLSGEFETILIVTSDGQIAADVRPLVRLNIDVVLEHHGRREHGYSGGGGRFDYSYFANEEMVFEYAREAVRQAVLNLEAIPAPAGTMPVVLGPGWPGVLIHESVGHGLEGDFNRKGLSIYSGKIGERVASPLCTIVDNGSLPQRRGSLNIDDEGTPTQCTTLIENGILRNYMLDKRNAELMGLQPTGNGRRESYSHLPMPRMTNTYLLPGQSTPEEIIASVEKGIYAVNFGGGQVDITSGKFVFTTSEAYLIEKGKITAPVKGATLIGNGPDTLNKISMVGNDLKLDGGIGVCGKDGQSVPVGVGMPTVRIDGITVGGTSSYE
jgi:TldD protein